MENRRIAGKGTHCKLDYLRAKDGCSRCGCHYCFLAWQQQREHWGRVWQKYNLKCWVAGKNKQTNKRHGISVPFAWSEETMWILIDLQNLVAVIMEHKMVALQGDLQWQQACYVACNALGLSCWSCTCGVPFCQTKAHCMSHGCCWSGRKGGCKCKNLRKRTPCLH